MNEESTYHELVKSIDLANLTIRDSAWSRNDPRHAAAIVKRDKLQDELAAHPITMRQQARLNAGGGY